MALERLGFIVIGDNFENEIGTAQFKLKVVSIQNPVKPLKWRKP